MTIRGPLESVETLRKDLNCHRAHQEIIVRVQNRVLEEVQAALAFEGRANWSEREWFISPEYLSFLKAEALLERMKGVAQTFDELTWAESTCVRIHRFRKEGETIGGLTDILSLGPIGKKNPYECELHFLPKTDQHLAILLITAHRTLADLYALYEMKQKGSQLNFFWADGQPLPKDDEIHIFAQQAETGDWSF